MLLAEQPWEAYDVSPALNSQIAVFPGDTPFSRKVLLDFKGGGNIELSTLTTTVHVGAHADAPSHYHPNGKPIDTRDLARYFGPCQVCSVTLDRGERIFPSDLKDKIQARRVLFRTGSFNDPSRWAGRFNSLSPELIESLADQGVVLIGIDTPSIDPSDSKPLESHQAIYHRDLAVLEGLALAQVPDGFYHLIAFPLRLEGFDASPVRAVLVKTPFGFPGFTLDVKQA